MLFHFTRGPNSLRSKKIMIKRSRISARCWNWIQIFSMQPMPRQDARTSLADMMTLSRPTTLHLRRITTHHSQSNRPRSNTVTWPLDGTRHRDFNSNSVSFLTAVSRHSGTKTPQSHKFPPANNTKAVKTSSRTMPCLSGSLTLAKCV